MKSLLFILLSLTISSAFSQTSDQEEKKEKDIDCKEIVVEASGGLEKKEHNKKYDEKFEQIIKIRGCGCETSLVKTEDISNYQKIQSKIVETIKNDCQTLDGNIYSKEVIEKAVRKKKNFFKKLFGGKEVTKNSLSISLNIGDIVYKEKNGRKNKALKKVSKCKKKIEKLITKIEKKNISDDDNNLLNSYKDDVKLLDRFLDLTPEENSRIKYFQNGQCELTQLKALQKKVKKQK